MRKKGCGMSGAAARTGKGKEKQKINSNSRIFSVRVIKNITRINNGRNKDAVCRIYRCM